MEPIVLVYQLLHIYRTVDIKPNINQNDPERAIQQ
jgi:hypothetical protein